MKSDEQGSYKAGWRVKSKEAIKQGEEWRARKLWSRMKSEDQGSYKAGWRVKIKEAIKQDEEWRARKL